MGLTFEELQRRGAKPVDAPAAPRRRLSFEDLQRAGAKPVDAQPSSGIGDSLSFGGLRSEVLRFLFPKGDGQPTPAESLARGAGQGITRGFQEEGSGLVDALFQKYPALQVLSPVRVLAHLSTGRPLEELVKSAAEESVKNEGKSLGDFYRPARDAYRADNEKAKAAHSGYYLGGEILGGGLLPMPGGAAAPGMKLGARLLRAAGQGATMGAGFGLGNSTADLTQGGYGKAALDTGIGALGGAGGGAAGEGLAAGLGALASKIQQRAATGIKDAEQLAAQKALTLQEKEIAGRQGEYRSAVQSASRDIEVLERAEQAAAKMPDTDIGRQAAEFLASKAGQDLRASVAANKLITAPQRIAEMTAKKEALDAAVAGKDEAVALMTREMLRDPVKKHVMTRLPFILKNAVPLATGVLGHALGGAEGAAVGGGLGTLYAMVRGSPWRSLSSMSREPGVRRMFWQKVLAASGGASPQGAAIVQALERAAQQGETAFATTAATLTRETPLAENILRKVAELGDERPKQRAQARADVP